MKWFIVTGFWLILGQSEQALAAVALPSYPIDLFHISVALLSFLVLLMAGLLALLLAWQEYGLRHKKGFFHVLQSLPPLEVIETGLFWMVGVAFALLTIVLVTACYFYHGLLWQSTILLQKTLFTLVAWLILLILLLGRHLRGWRGRQAIYYTLSGFLLLLLALCANYWLIHLTTV